MPPTDLCLLGFAGCLFALYSLMPIVMERTSAASVNLNLLSADFYALLIGLFLFQYKVCIFVFQQSIRFSA
jgi:solute carrier family 35 protein F1/2